MLSATTIGTIMYASILVLLCIGFSFTHMMEKFPNFAHISYANIARAGLSLNSSPTNHYKPNK